MAHTNRIIYSVVEHQVFSYVCVCVSELALLKAELAS